MLFLQERADANSTFADTATFNNGSAFVNYRPTSQLAMGAGYHYTRLTGPASAHYHQINLAADYTLSKRTDVYAIAAYQKASGSTPDSNGALKPAQAVIGDYDVNSGAANQTLLTVGMRHRF